MTGSRRRDIALLLAGILLVALNLRFALTSVGPLVDDLRSDLGLSAAAAGLLTTLPLIALGLISPLAPRLADRFGAERVVLGCMAALTVVVLLRGMPSAAPLFLGALLTGCAIAVGNVLMPGIVKHRFGTHAATAMGFYTVGLTAGGALAAGLAVPIEDAFGSWRVSLAAWAVPAALAAALWLPQLRRPAAERLVRAGRRGRGGAAAEPISLWRDRRAWAVTLFMGLQSAIFYCTVAWLPEILRAEGQSASAAGGLLSLSMLLGIPLALLTGTFAGRMRDQRPLAVIAAVLPVVAWLGLLLVPGAMVLWIVVLGIGAGTGFPLVLTLLVLRARDVRHTAALSGMAQAVGYALAATGPLALGALHDLTGSWTAPLVVLAAIGVPELVVALAASRPGFVGAAHPCKETNRSSVISATA